MIEKEKFYCRYNDRTKMLDIKYENQEYSFLVDDNLSGCCEVINIMNEKLTIIFVYYRDEHHGLINHKYLNLIDSKGNSLSINVDLI